MSEDVYDVGRREPAEMECQDCGAIFAEFYDPDTDEEYGLMDDRDECPGCGSPRIWRYVPDENDGSVTYPSREHE
jgi:predicted nucleic-acid-binding Zn-ribbon protein